jgi:hypothetical protein
VIDGSTLSSLRFPAALEIGRIANGPDEPGREIGVLADMGIAQAANHAQRLGHVHRALAEDRERVRLLVEAAVDPAEVGAAEQVGDVEALQLIQPVGRVVIVGTDDEIEEAPGRRKQAHFLRDLIEAFGEAVVHRMVNALPLFGIVWSSR